MKTYLDCWISSAKTLFSQALTGEPQLVEAAAEARDANGLAYRAEIAGEVSGSFTVVLDTEIVQTPLLGDGVDQSEAWAELLREVAEAAGGELLAASGLACRVVSCAQVESNSAVTRAFRLMAPGHSWSIVVQDDLRALPDSAQPAATAAVGDGGPQHSPGLELLLDVELEAALRFGCCEMPLGEILDLGPGDVVELDRHIDDPVDLIVGDKIVARGEVVLINGNFGLRVSEVSTPQNRLESIRCLF